tara:strand:+ start:789 stop:1382 length:594 start_codon:yes stop_codon:yes gene_type:complete
LKLIVGNTALVVIDMQKGGGMPVEASGIPTMAGFDIRVQKISKLVHFARTRKIPVIFFAEIHRANYVDFGRELDGVEGIHCIEGAEDTQLDSRLMPIDGDYFIAKRRYSCFFGTDLAILLSGLRVKTLILTGELTDVCVHYTFVDAHQRDYHIKVLEDCVGGSTIERHSAALAAMRYLQRDSVCLSDTFMDQFHNEQ